MKIQGIQRVLVWECIYKRGFYNNREYRESFWVIKMVALLNVVKHAQYCSWSSMIIVYLICQMAAISCTCFSCCGVFLIKIVISECLNMGHCSFQRSRGTPCWAIKMVSLLNAVTNEDTGNTESTCLRIHLQRRILQQQRVQRVSV